MTLSLNPIQKLIVFLQTIRSHQHPTFRSRVATHLLHFLCTHLLSMESDLIKLSMCILAAAVRQYEDDIIVYLRAHGPTNIGSIGAKVSSTKGIMNACTASFDCSDEYSLPYVHRVNICCSELLE